MHQFKDVTKLAHSLTIMPSVEVMAKLDLAGLSHTAFKTYDFAALGRNVEMPSPSDQCARLCGLFGTVETTGVGAELESLGRQAGRTRRRPGLPPDADIRF
jgi:hypothetical protein